MSKQALRSYYRERIRPTLSEEYRKARSRSLVLRLFEHPWLIGAQAIGLYMPLPDEPDLSCLLADLPDKAWCLPRTKGNGQMDFCLYQGAGALAYHRYGMQEPTGGEPIAPESLELIIVPAIAYDRDGYRLGRGAGYYDRYLAHTICPTIGVSMGLLPVVSLPRDPWDVAVSQVLG